jgi:hypothetical protein
MIEMQTLLQLRSIEADGDVTDAPPMVLLGLRQKGLIYTVNVKGRKFAHLKERGRKALQQEGSTDA